jgi:SP family facilitated glucose transporter-like MFS transporter 1
MNFFAVFFTGLFLKRYGRRTLMVIFPALIVVTLLVVSGCLWTQPSKADVATNTIALVMIVLFVIFFEFSMGPILWLYNSEILNDKAVTVASAINWVFVLAISAVTPYLLSHWHGKFFLIFAGFTIFHCFFAFFVMKETKDLPDEEVKNLYNPLKGSKDMGHKLVEESDD